MQELYYRHSGSGPALIILHGLFGMSDNWVSFARHLETEFSVFLPDQRNHGQSFHSPQMDYPTLSRDMAGFIKQKKLAPVNIIGHSMGGKVLMHLAAENPEMVKRMMIVDISPRQYSNPLFSQFIKALQEINLSVLTSRTEAEVKLADSIGNAAIRQFLLKNLYRTDSGLFAWRINLPAIDLNLELLMAEFNPKQPVETETLFIRGGNSNHIAAEDITLIGSIFKHVYIQTIDNASHWVHADKPAELIHITKKFFKK